MSAPFGGPPSLSHKPAKTDIHAELAALDRPRKHYQWYYSGPEANADMHNCPQGLHDFLRAYYHHKSADWALNQPFPLAGWQAEALAQMPSYYIMDYANNMAATVAPEMPSASAIKQCQWLPDNELAVYSQAFERTGFQGGLNWYRCATDEHYRAELQLFSGRSIDVPSCFIAGQQDWGVYQKPGDFEAMQTQACSQMRGCHRLDGAGHWVQQEQAEQVSRLLLEFLQTL
jgi:pimeloyl-ACP methyl ester carboxylesterase